MRRYQLFIGGPCNERLEHQPGIRRSEGVKPPLRQVRNTWGKMKAEQISQGEDVVDDTAAIGAMGCNAQVGLVVEKPVGDMGGFAGRRDRDRMVRRLAR
jgi:hypothetical protein